MEIINTTTYAKGEEGWNALVDALMGNNLDSIGFVLLSVDGAQYPQQTLNLHTTKFVQASGRPVSIDFSIVADLYDGAAVLTFSDKSVGLVVNMADSAGKRRSVMFRNACATIGDTMEDAIKEGLKLSRSATYIIEARTGEYQNN